MSNVETHRTHRSVPWALAAAGLVVAALALAACGDDGEGIQPTLEPLPSATPAQETPDDATEPAATATTEPTPDNEADSLACSERGQLETELAEDVEAAMDGYNGEWGFALYDIGCDSMTTVNGDYEQYPASASKIISLIAVMRAVDDGSVDLEQVEDLMETVIRQSLDHETDLLEDFIEPQDLDQVLIDSNVSDAASIDGEWRYTSLTPPDMARIWAALVEGELLSEESTDYLVELATNAEIPEIYQTFPSPSEWDDEDFSFGQKPGYYVFDGVPYYLVGAGYLLHDEDPNLRFIPVLFARTMTEDLHDPQRREPWDIFRDYVDELTEG